MPGRPAARAARSRRPTPASDCTRTSVSSGSASCSCGSCGVDPPLIGPLLFGVTDIGLEVRAVEADDIPMGPVAVLEREARTTRTPEKERRRRKTPLLARRSVTVLAVIAAALVGGYVALDSYTQS